jgi:adenylate cyclase class 2
MEEVEAKLLEVDEDEIYDALADSGAERVFEGDVRSEFYDFPDGRIEEEGVLRLRKMGDKTFVTLKRDISREESKVMEEIEFGVEDPDAFRSFLTSIGLEKIRESHKHRSKWEDGDVEYVVDSYPGIPPLLEIEAPDTAYLEEAFTELGYDFEETVSWDAGQVFDHYDG